jgi:hypothetical protein
MGRAQELRKEAAAAAAANAAKKRASNKRAHEAFLRREATEPTNEPYELNDDQGFTRPGWEHVPDYLGLNLPASTLKRRIYKNGRDPEIGFLTTQTNRNTRRAVTQFHPFNPANHELVDLNQTESALAAKERYATYLREKEERNALEAEETREREAEEAARKASRGYLGRALNTVGLGKFYGGSRTRRRSHKKRSTRRR